MAVGPKKVQKRANGKDVKGRASSQQKRLPAIVSVQDEDEDGDASFEGASEEEDDSEMSSADVQLDGEGSDESEDVTEEGLERLMNLLDEETVRQAIGADAESIPGSDDDSEEAEDSDSSDGVAEPAVSVRDKKVRRIHTLNILETLLNQGVKAVVLDKVHSTFKLRPAFFDNLNLVYPSALDIPKPDDDLQRELQFYKQALWGALEAQSRFKSAQLPFQRPDDFFAEMVKSDAQMAKIRQSLLDESASIKASQEARKLRDAKKFGKKVQVEKRKEREREEKAVGKKIDSLKKKRRNREAGFETAEDFDVALENALVTSKEKKRKMPESERRKMPRKVRESKFGFGNKQGGGRRSKENNDRTDPAPFSKRGKPAGRGFAGRGRGGRGARGGRGSR